MDTFRIASSHLLWSVLVLSVDLGKDADERVLERYQMRAMAILYVGPKQNPDFQTDYYISPILAPEGLLAQFPPVLMICGEKDPFVDDTVIWAGMHSFFSVFLGNYLSVC